MRCGDVVLSRSGKEVGTISTRERILRAAHQVAAREGIGHLTLDAVASEAGLSKGGLLYHFPSKEALVTGLVSHFAGHFEQALDHAMRSRSPGTGAFVSAFIEATFAALPAPDALHTGLLAALLLHPDLLEEFRRQYGAWHDAMRDDGLDPTLASLLRYAADGLWASQLLGLAPPSKQLQRQLRGLMLRLARGDRVEPHQPGKPDF